MYRCRRARSLLEAPFEFREAAMQPRLNRSFRPVEALGECFPAHAVEIGEPDNLPLLGLELVEALQQALDVLLAPENLEGMLIIALDTLDIGTVQEWTSYAPAHLV